MYKRLAGLALALVAGSILSFFMCEWGIRSLVGKISSDGDVDLRDLELSWLDGPQFAPESVQAPAGHSSVYSYINRKYPTEVNRMRVLQALESATFIALFIGLIVLAGLGIEASFRLG